MFNFNHLYYFYITAKSGSVTAAANHLRISQPSLSSQLKVLEEFLELKLFHKVGRANQLSESGVIVYGFCRRMFVVSEELSEVILERLPSAVRRINIGVSNEVERSFLVDVVSYFLGKYEPLQRPKVNMISGTHEELVERLRFHELDAIVSQQAPGDPDLTTLIRMESPVSLLCSNQKADSKKGKAPLKAEPLSPSAIRDMVDGNQAPWIMPSPGTKLRLETDRFFGKHKLKGRILFESDVVASLSRSVVDGIGFAFLPLLYAATEIQDKFVRVLGPKDGYWKYEIWLGCHSQNQNDLLYLSLAQSFKHICDMTLSSISK